MVLLLVMKPVAANDLGRDAWGAVWLLMLADVEGLTFSMRAAGLAFSVGGSGFL